MGDPAISAYSSVGVEAKVKEAGIMTESTGLVAAVGLEQPGGLFLQGKAAFAQEIVYEPISRETYNQKGPSFTGTVGFNRSEDEGLYGNMSARYNMSQIGDSKKYTGVAQSYFGEMGTRVYSPLSHLLPYGANDINCETGFIGQRDVYKSNPNFNNTSVGAGIRFVQGEKSLAFKAGMQKYDVMHDPEIFGQVDLRIGLNLGKKHEKHNYSY